MLQSSNVNTTFGTLELLNNGTLQLLNTGTVEHWNSKRLIKLKTPEYARR